MRRDSEAAVIDIYMTEAQAQLDNMEDVAKGFLTLAGGFFFLLFVALAIFF
jgi:hypothetical protein